MSNRDWALDSDYKGSICTNMCRVCKEPFYGLRGRQVCWICSHARRREVEKGLLGRVGVKGRPK